MGIGDHISHEAQSDVGSALQNVGTEKTISGPILCLLSPENWHSATDHLQQMTDAHNEAV